MKAKLLCLEKPAIIIVINLKNCFSNIYIYFFFAYTGEKFHVDCEPRQGLVCRNSDQSDRYCQDYRVRFLCPAGTISYSQSTCVNYCPTRWLDRDNPSGVCDCETLKDFSPSQTCPNPVGIKCRHRSTRKDYQDVGQKMICNQRSGGICWNRDNPGNPCKDYEVQFLCPC